MSEYTILEFGEYVSVPYAGKMFSDTGAEVIKVEPKTGDIARQISPFVGDEKDSNNSGFFAYLNTGKKGITLNPDSDRSDRIVEAIVEEFDVDLIIESNLKDYGWDPNTISNKYDQLCVVSVSGFGASGPEQYYDAPEIVAMAESGHMNKMGYPDKPPTRPQVKSADYWAGQHASLGGLSVLLSRDLQGTGEGYHVDVSKREAAITYMEGFITGYSWSGATTERKGYGYPDQDGQPGLPAIYETTDGHISAAVTGAWWDTVCEDVLGRPNLTEDERFKTPEMRLKNLEEIREIIQEYTRTREKWELFFELQELGIPSGVTATSKDLVELDHLNERNFWQDVPLANDEEVTMPGFPFRTDESTVKMERPPRIGEHNVDIYGNLDVDVEDLTTSEVI